MKTKATTALQYLSLLLSISPIYISSFWQCAVPSDEVTYHCFGTVEDFAVSSHPLLCHFELEKVFNSRSTCLYVPPMLSEDRNVEGKVGGSFQLSDSVIFVCPCKILPRSWLRGKSVGWRVIDLQVKGFQIVKKEGSHKLECSIRKCNDQDMLPSVGFLGKNTPIKIG